MLLAKSLLLIVATLHQCNGFPSYRSLGGLSEREQNAAMDKLAQVAVYPPPPPPKMEYNGTKLVNDEAHPWMPLREGDIRGPCPGLNTLASHGYLPRDGVVTPVQLITAVQEGFNFEYETAVGVVYAAMLVDGNVVTNLLSIGGKTSKTGPDPPAPAIVGGLNTHDVFEGDASMTRGDVFFGDVAGFNQTLFDQFVDFSNRYGDGYYNLTVAAEYRFHLIQQGIATNPNFSYIFPRYFAGYAESVLALNLFVDGRDTTPVLEGKKLDMDTALSFFRDSRFPPDFHRSSIPAGGIGFDEIMAAHPFMPCRNLDGKVNNCVVHEISPSDAGGCGLYNHFIDQVIALYPNPKGVLRRNLILNMHYIYLPFEQDCEELFPYGRL
ncbi:heme-thiolate peroxidase, partial [Candolleomyces efflorescens]